MPTLVVGMSEANSHNMLTTSVVMAPVYSQFLSPTPLPLFGDFYYNSPT
jgi:hypothetical protein